MIRADMIPDEAVEAAAKHISEADMEDYPNYWKKQLRASIAAALNAWPDVIDTHPNNIGHLLLQFKEARDDASAR